MIFLEYFTPSSQSEIKKEEVKLENKQENDDNNSKQENKFDNSIVRIRINNCFVDAKKEYLEQAKKELEKVSNSINIDGKIKSILLDSNVIAASSKYLIFTSISEHVKDTANNMLGDIEKVLKKELNKDLLPIFLTNEEWNIEKENYVKNIKNGKKYEFIEEKNKNNDANDLNILNDIFDKSKIEVI